MTTTTAPGTEEDAALRRTVAAIAERCRAARGADGDDHAACWQALDRAGLTELRTSDGTGAPLATVGQTVIVVEELARAVCGAPLVGTLLASELLRLAEVAEEVTATVLLTADLQRLGVGDDARAWDAARPVDHALGLREGQLVLTPLGSPAPTQDLSRPVAAPAGAARPIGALNDDTARTFEAFAQILLAADLLGASSSVLESAVEYAGQRIQFGQTIASFQAVQHLCARAHVKVEAQRSALLFAAWSHESGGVDPLAPMVAKAYANRAAVDVAEAAIQVFGGVAITWEYPAHRHLRRVLLDAEVLGRAADLETRLLDLAKGTSDGLQ